MSDLNKLKELASRTHVEEWEYKVINGNKRVIVKGSLERGQGYFSCRSVVYEIDSTPNAKFIAAANPATVIALIDQLEAAEALAEFRGKNISSLDKLIADRDKRIAELENDSQEVARLAGANAARAQKAEAELERRDAAAGDAVAVYQYQQSLTPDIGDSMDFWVDCSKEAYEEESTEGGIVRKLFTAAQPSALPPEVTEPVGEWHRRYHCEGAAWVAGANWMREKVKALGCKAIKLPKVNHPAQFDYADRLTESLKAQGFTVERE